MKKFAAVILLLCMASLGYAAGGENVKDNAMKIKMSFAGREVIVQMEDNIAARQVLALLPAEFDFIDFAGEEKITEFPRPLSLADAPRGMIATAGKMFIYAPWGNMGFFYKNHGSTPDKNLIPLGEVISGLEYLAAQTGGFTARLELMDN